MWNSGDSLRIMRHSCGLKLASPEQDGRNVKQREMMLDLVYVRLACKFAFAPHVLYKLKCRISVTADVMEVKLYLWFAFGRSWVLISARISVIETEVSQRLISPSRHISRWHIKISHDLFPPTYYILLFRT